MDDTTRIGRDCALALDAADRPHISYMDEEMGAVKYAHYDGVAWHIETMDGGWGDYWGSGYTSLALDAAGRPHIGYADSPHGDVKYAHMIDCVPVETVTVTGPASLPAGTDGLHTASYAPMATLHSLTWDNGARGGQAMYSWLLTGTHLLTATADYYCAATTGAFTVTVFCQPPTGAAIQGPGALVPGLTGIHAASPLPITTSPPLTFTWDNGTVGATAAYSWSVTGTQVVTVTVTNRCGQAEGVYLVRVLAAWPYSFYLPLLLHDEP